VAQKWQQNKLGGRNEHTPKRQKQQGERTNRPGHFIIANLVFIIG
jgi:hypothetical protein